jgi:hypothetical protein
MEVLISLPAFPLIECLGGVVGYGSAQFKFDGAGGAAKVGGGTQQRRTNAAPPGVWTNEEVIENEEPRRGCGGEAGK